MIAVENWRQRYANELLKNTIEYEKKNEQAAVTTRTMTAEEFQEAFGQKRESCHKLKIKEKEGKL